MKKTSLNGLDLYHYYRLEDFSAETLRKLVSQLLETFIAEGACVCLVDLDSQQFRQLAQAYRDLTTGYKHPRISSSSWHYMPNDSLLQRLQSIFPDWEVANPSSLLPSPSTKKT